MHSMDGPSFAFPEGVLAREVDGEMVLLNLHTEQYYGLNGIGADIVRRLTGLPFDEALDSLRRDYEVDPAELTSDVNDLVDDLMEAGLLAKAQDHR